MSFFDFIEELAPGVEGYTVRHPNGDLSVPIIEATRPGNGDVGRYLDSLPIDRLVIVPNVINARLEGMLVRRGFSFAYQFAEEFEDWCPLLVRESLV